AQEALRSTGGGAFAGIGQYISFTLGMGAAPMRVRGSSATLMLPAQPSEGAQQWSMQFKNPPAPVDGSAFGKLVHRASGLGVELEAMGGHDWTAWRLGGSLERARRLGSSPLSLTGSLAYSTMEARTDVARTVVVGDGYLVSTRGQRYQSTSTYSAVAET